MTRKSLTKSRQAEVLLKSRRRCCICFGLNRGTSIKQGQIAHLDGDASNDSEDNLAFLCFEHHDQYDSKTRQSKNFTQQEVLSFRQELHAAVAQAFHSEVKFGETAASVPDRFSGHYIRESEYDSAEITVERMSDGRYHVYGLALWGKKREYGPNIGELDFVTSIANGEAEYTEAKQDGDPYRAVFSFDEHGLNLSEENWAGVFGMNVMFAGAYARAT